ncbi:ubiquinone/menaquinone biosynthesis methyltransferase [Alkalihalophilus pseudofirmus OF4]|uniref:Ubiquinone/menaquinone biosynthesis methyltransferase n=2 Tax=Alkalihalophilus pseudofirmus TaxID=79885 RepID=D3FTA3_ALKPO|nr:class I SAM-dependent methyltransferase [Alkalihalophilus pseudofirmus]ADC48171.1 ubiquinone/menaquinone biosynthesis methyltransferase [Alkalihalophilus pseudofirmus OF4]MDV2885339.1 methyltransferase domain-containing protein [Alkalihalophilus pseudofirmus]WEG15683.1 methyltransferase domain-containing protein [Alkalihalophilus pseudofirmus]
MRKMDGAEFDSLVSFFDGMARTNWLSKVHDQLKEMSGTWRSKEILDVGCGTGRLLTRGLNEADRIVGVDLSEEMITAAKELFQTSNTDTKNDFIVGDAYHLPFEDETFDCALSTCVMFLLPEPEKGITEMLRVTKKSGTIVMLNPSETMNPERASSYADRNQMTGFEKETLVKWSNVSTRRHRYSEQSLSSVLTKLGAKKVTHQPVVGGLAMITVAQK